MAVSGGLIDGGGGGFHEEDHPRDAKGEFASKGGKDDSQADAGGDNADDEEGSAPSQKELASLSRDGYHPATDEEWKALKWRPNGLTDRWIADDPDAVVQALGRDSRGRICGKYSAAHMKAQAAAKFRRVQLVHQELPSIMIQASSEADNHGKNREEASVVRLIILSGFRNGNVGNKTATPRIGADGKPVKGADGKVIKDDQPTYGATTLEPKHVKIEGDTVHFDFIGKAAVRQQHSITDPDLAADIQQRLDAGTPTLFQTRADKVREYLKKVGRNPSFKVHDLRTWNATETARRTMNGMEAPTTPEAYWAQRDAVGEAAGKKIGDPRDMALDNYVDPLIFEEWRTRAGVPEDAERPKKGKGK